MRLKPLMSLKPVNREENSEICLANFLQSHPRMIGNVIVKDNSIYPKNRRAQNNENFVFLFN